MAQQIQLRRGTASQWTSVNPVLAQGEPGVETDTGKFKIGDGSTAWTALAYVSAPDATTGSKGMVQIAGDLAGTAAAPTVPGLAGKVDTTRQVTAGTGLTGGGTLAADRTLAVSFGTASGTAAQGNDSRITGAAQKSANLSDLTSPPAGRTSLGLGTAAVAAASAFAPAHTVDAVTTTLTGTLAVGHLTSIDASAGAAAYTLPAASSTTAGQTTAAKKNDTSANAVTIQRAGSDVIYGTGAGSTTKTLTVPGESCVLVSNGTNAWTVQSADLPLGQLDTRYNAAYAPLRRYEATALYVYGHSYTISPGVQCTSGLEWFQRVKTRLAASSVTTYGVSSGRMLDSMFDVIGQGPGTPVAGCTWPVGTRRGMAFIETMFNDVYNSSTNTGGSASVALTTANLVNIADELRTALAVLSASARVEFTTTTGTGWTTASSTLYSGGSHVRTTVQNDYVQATVTATATGVVYILMYITSGGPWSDASISVDGTVAATALGANVQVATQTDRRAGASQIVFPLLVKLTGLSAGSHTIRVTKTDATTNFMYVDAAFPQAVAPVPVVVLKDPVCRGGGTPYDTSVAQMTANRALLSPVYDTVCAEFSNVVLVDPALDPTTCLGSDGAHPNDRGMGKIAEAIVKGLGASTYDPDMLYTTMP